MSTKRPALFALLLFLISWAAFFLMSTPVPGETPDLSAVQRAGITAALACAAPLLYLVIRRNEPKGKPFRVFRPGGDEPVYRVEGEWICKGAEEKVSYYIKRGGLYGFESMTPLCHIKDGKVYRHGESEPFLVVEGNEIRAPGGGRAEYEIRE